MAVVDAALKFLLQNIWTFLIVLLVTVIVRWYITHSRYKLPPGPYNWSIITGGDLFKPKEDDNGSAKRMLAMSKKYNSDIVSLRIGTTVVAIFNRYEDMRDALSSMDFHFKIKSIFTLIFGGIINAENKRWREQRRFALHTLRDFGLGKNRVQQIIQKELSSLSAEIKKNGTAPMHTDMLLKNVSSNIICSLIFGHRFDYDDANFQHITQSVDKIFKLGIAARQTFWIPFAEYIPGDLFSLKALKKTYAGLREGILRKEFNDHLRRHDPDVTNDYIDAFIHKMKMMKDTEEEHWFTEDQLMAGIGDLLFAGTDTTATTLSWCLLCMASYPDVQTRVRAEIHSVVGKEDPPSMSHKLDLPLTEATILEVQRTHPLVPVIMHSTGDKDTHFKGYTFPPRTIVAFNLHALNMDPNNWSNPQDFKPQHFIGEEGKVKRDQYLKPFSLGKRQCLGESLATTELFLFFTGILQKFKVSVDPGCPTPSLTPLLGSITNSPKPHKLCYVYDE